LDCCHRGYSFVVVGITIAKVDLVLWDNRTCSGPGGFGSSSSPVSTGPAGGPPTDCVFVNGLDSRPTVIVEIAAPQSLGGSGSRPSLRCFAALAPAAACRCTRTRWPASWSRRPKAPHYRSRGGQLAVICERLGERGTMVPGAKAVILVKIDAGKPHHHHLQGRPGVSGHWHPQRLVSAPTGGSLRRCTAR